MPLRPSRCLPLMQSLNVSSKSSVCTMRRNNQVSQWDDLPADEIETLCSGVRLWATLYGCGGREAPMLWSFWPWRHEHDDHVRSTFVVMRQVRPCLEFVDVSQPHSSTRILPSLIHQHLDDFTYQISQSLDRRHEAITLSHCRWHRPCLRSRRPTPMRNNLYGQTNW